LALSVGVSFGVSASSSLYERIEFSDGCPHVVLGQVGVSHRHLDRLVAQQFCHCPQRNTAHNQPTSEGVAQVVPREVFDSRFANCIFKPMARAKQGLSVPRAGKDRTLAAGPLVQFPECSQSCAIQGDMAGATILALGYEQIFPFQVNAVPGYPSVLLASSHPGIHGNFQLGKMLREILRDDLPKPSLFIGRMLV
jgi:hypothetical protein